MTMFNFGKLGRGWLVAGALALSVCMSACGSSNNNSGAGGSTGVNAAGGATGSGGVTGTGGITTVTDGGMDASVNPDSGMDTATDTNPTTGELPTHLMLINGANSTFNGQTSPTVGVPVTTPAPTMSLASCQI